MAELKAGDAAPDMALPSGGRLLSRPAGRSLVLYFYPKDDTSGCTKEAIAFTGLLPEFDAAGAAVVGVSPDTEKSHERFSEKYDLRLRLVADPERKVIDAYDAWKPKSMYGRSFMGVERCTFLIGPDDRIARIWRKVSVPGHAEEVLQAARALAPA